MYVYIYIYMHTYMYIHIYIYLLYMCIILRQHTLPVIKKWLYGKLCTWTHALMAFKNPKFVQVTTDFLISR